LAEITELEKAARVVLNSNLAARLAVITPRTESIDPEQELAIRKFTGPIEEAKAQLVKALQHIEPARKVIKDRPRPTQTGAKTFMTAFVEELVYAWFRLTREKPGPADTPFHAFVAGAFKTLQMTTPMVLGLPFYVTPWNQERMALRQRSVQKKKSGWEHQIRVSLADMSKRRATDGAERYRDGVEPDGVGVQPLPQRAGRNFPEGAHVLDYQETRRLICVMNAGGDDGRGAASVLWTEYDLGSEQRRRRYDGLDFNPAEAVTILVPPKASDAPPALWRMVIEGGPTLYFTAEDHRIFGPSFAPSDNKVVD
jgi:hypothetical protein